MQRTTARCDLWGLLTNWLPVRTTWEMSNRVIVKYNRLPTRQRKTVGSSKGWPSSLLSLALSSSGVSKTLASPRRAELIKSLAYLHCVYEFRHDFETYKIIKKTKMMIWELLYQLRDCHWWSYHRHRAIDACNSWSPPDKERAIVLTLVEISLKDCSSKLIEPSSRSLFEHIKRLFQLTKMLRRTRTARRRSHADTFLQNTMEEGIHDIHLS